MFTTERILFVIVFLLGLVPTLSGPLGGIPSTAVDLVKAILHLFGKTLKEGWGGYLFLAFGAIVFVAVLWITGVNPAEYVLPANAEQVVKLLINLATTVISLASMYKGGQLWHTKVLKSLAPKLVSIKAQAASRPKNPVPVEARARAS